MFAGSQSSLLKVLLFAILSALLFRTAGYMDAFHLPEGYAYDTLVRLSPAGKRARRVLIVERTYGAGGRTSVFEDLDYIESLNPRLVVFTHYPPNADAVFYDTAKRLGNVVFGRPLSHSTETLDEMVPMEVPAEATGKGVRSGIYIVPPGDYGIHRRQFVWIQIADERMPTIEGIVAEEFGLQSKYLNENSFSVDFRGKKHAIPRVTMKRLANRDILPQMVRDNIVLVGYIHALDMPGLSTPLTPAGEMMDPVEFHAYAIDTLLAGSGILFVPPWLVCLISILIAVLLVFVYHNVTSRAAVLFTLFLLLILALGASLSLAVFDMRLPIVELSLTVLLVAMIAMADSYHQSERLLNRTLIDMSDTLHERVFVPELYHAESYWTQVAQLTAKLLNLEKSVLLTRDKHNQLSHAECWGCSDKDLAEKNRDISKRPFAAAAQEGATVSPESHFFLNHSDAQIEQIVPLVFAGRLEGFWVYALSKEQIKSDIGFSNHVQLLASQLAELMYHRREEHEREMPGRSGMASYINRGRRDKINDALAQSVTLVDQRLSAMEQFLDQLSVPTAIYDVFGNLLRMNDRMATLLAGSGIDSFELSALDLMVGVSGKLLEDVNPIFRRTVLGREVTNLEGFLTVDSEKEAVSIKLTPLDSEVGAAASSHGERGSIAKGFLCEITEEGEIEKSIGYRCELQHVIVDYLDDCVQECEQPDSSPDVLRRMSELLGVSKKYLSAPGNDAGASPAFPSNLATAVKVAMQRVLPSAKERRVDIDFSCEPDSVFVLAEPQRLSLLIERILTFLLDDAVSESKISLQAVKVDNYLEFKLFNTGFGIPDERFQSYLTATGDSSAFVQLRESLAEMKEWKAELQGESKVGKGTVFTLNLRVVI